MISNRAVCVLSCAVIAGAAFSQFAPVCCKYIYTWPSEHNPPYPTNLCTTGYGRVCEEYGTYPGGQNDPLSRKREGWRNAQCRHFTIADGSSFAQGPCTGGPPPGGVLVGVLPNGLCCYYVQGPDGPAPDIIDRGYLIWNCEKECTSSPT